MDTARSTISHTLHHQNKVRWNTFGKAEILSSPINQGYQKFERIKSKNKTWALSLFFNSNPSKKSRNLVIKRGNLHKHLHSNKLPPKLYTIFFCT
jgi:hypothetical protein